MSWFLLAFAAAYILLSLPAVKAYRQAKKTPCEGIGEPEDNSVECCGVWGNPPKLETTKGNLMKTTPRNNPPDPPVPTDTPQYLEGEAAFLAGESHDDCPTRHKDRDRREWFAGWFTARSNANLAGCFERHGVGPL